MCEVQKGLYSLQKAWLRFEFWFGKLHLFSPEYINLPSSCILVLFVSCRMWPMQFKRHVFANSLQTEKSCEAKGLVSIPLEPLKIFLDRVTFLLLKLCSFLAHTSPESLGSQRPMHFGEFHVSWWELSILGMMWIQNCEFSEISLSLKFFAWLGSYSQLLPKSAGVFPLSSVYFGVHLYTLGWNWKS